MCISHFDKARVVITELGYLAIMYVRPQLSCVKIILWNCNLTTPPEGDFSYVFKKRKLKQWINKLTWCGEWEGSVTTESVKMGQTYTISGLEILDFFPGYVRINHWPICIQKYGSQFRSTLFPKNPKYLLKVFDLYLELPKNEFLQFPLKVYIVFKEVLQIRHSSSFCTTFIKCPSSG